MVGYAIEDRQQIDTGGNKLRLTDINLQFYAKGQVVGFQIYTKKVEGSLHLGIWRHVSGESYRYL